MRTWQEAHERVNNRGLPAALWCTDANNQRSPPRRSCVSLRAVPLVRLRDPLDDR